MDRDALCSPRANSPSSAANDEKLIRSVEYDSRLRPREPHVTPLSHALLGCTKSSELTSNLNITLEGLPASDGGSAHPQAPHAFREQCSLSPTSNMNSDRNHMKLEKSIRHCTKSDKATLIITNTSSEESVKRCGGGGGGGTLEYLRHRIDTLEMRVERQDTAFRRLRPDAAAPSTAGARGGSVVHQYSRVPDTPPALRCMARAPPAAAPAAGPAPPPRPSDEERYGRELAAYDGITDTRRRRAAGGPRRESASVPLERAEPPPPPPPPPRARAAPDPMRQYRLADTVHYLAQGEFAPRSDGIKLTPSREAVLSDIIWEDVCRSHWPAARLASGAGGGAGGASRRRPAPRTDLQRQIDSLLRERVAHVERRRRRHYRVMKMNEWPGKDRGNVVGKTGDVIVASGRESGGGRGAGRSASEAEPGPRLLVHGRRGARAGGGGRGGSGAGGSVEEHYILLPTLVVKTSAQCARRRPCRARPAPAPDAAGGSGGGGGGRERHASALPAVALVAHRSGDSSSDDSSQ